MLGSHCSARATRAKGAILRKSRRRHGAAPGRRVSHPARPADATLAGHRRPGGDPTDSARIQVRTRFAVVQGMALQLLNDDEVKRHVDALSQGEWSVIEQYDEDGRRYVVAVRDADANARSRTLTEREAAVVARVARGDSNKLVASELSVSVSTVAGHIAMAMARWRVSSRVELIARWNLLQEVMTQSAVPFGPSAGASAGPQSRTSSGSTPSRAISR
jgi:DNA-binding CsgD family transcriptional regulator